MELDEQVLLELTEKYEVSLLYVKKFYYLIKDFPCVFHKDEESLLRCLEMIIQDRISNSFIGKMYDEKIDKIKHYKNIEYSISDALYNIYEDDAIDYLSDEYKYINCISPTRRL